MAAASSSSSAAASFYSTATAAAAKATASGHSAIVAAAKAIKRASKMTKAAKAAGDSSSSEDSDIECSVYADEDIGDGGDGGGGGGESSTAKDPDATASDSDASARLSRKDRSVKPSHVLAKERNREASRERMRKLRADQKAKRVLTGAGSKNDAGGGGSGSKPGVPRGSYNKAPDEVKKKRTEARRLADAEYEAENGKKKRKVVERPTLQKQKQMEAEIQQLRVTLTEANQKIAELEVSDHKTRHDLLDVKHDQDKEKAKLAAVQGQVVSLQKLVDAMNTGFKPLYPVAVPPPPPVTAAASYLPMSQSQVLTTAFTTAAHHTDDSAADSFLVSSQTH